MRAPHGTPHAVFIAASDARAPFYFSRGPGIPSWRGPPPAVHAVWRFQRAHATRLLNEAASAFVRGTFYFSRSRILISTAIAFALRAAYALPAAAFPPPPDEFR